jgi:chemotaxis protein methyltransferase CheR
MSFDLASFKMLIKERCGLLFEDHGEEKLANALADRADAVGASPGDYYRRLHGDDGEFQLLVNLLTINETYFFREPEQIRLLIERLAPRMLAARAMAGSTAPLRILSAGCSSGEEPYSLAMGMLDKFGEAALRQFTFTGGDIDSTVLAKARSGRYTDFSFRGVPADVRARYFRKERWSNLLDDRVKRLVSFFELNLLAESFPPELQGFDIIFFRNVSIYFDMETRKVIQRNLASLMKADGILVIGTAETLANDLGVLPLVEEDGLFYFVKGKPPLPDHVTQASTTVAREALPPLISSLQSAAALAAASVLKAPLPVASPLVPPGAWSLPAVAPVATAAVPLPTFTAPSAKLSTPVATDARRLAEERRWDEALPVLDALLAATPGNAEALLLKAYVLINRKDFAAAEALAQRVLDVDAWSVDAFLLLGLAAKWRQLNETAIKWFKQAAYARHECWPAHYYLADLYRGGGETEQARRAYRVVIQLLAGGAPDTGIQHVPLGLPLGEIRFLCEHQLAKLSGAQTLAVQK